MRILFIAPIPPPINGQSKASKILFDALNINKNEITCVNLGKQSLKSGNISFGRTQEILKILYEVCRNRKSKDLIYLSLSESFGGNLRDLIVYFICFKNRKNTFIHMLGGAGMKKILSANSLQKKINKFFINKLGGVLVEGPINFEMFSNVINEDKIHIVPNFAEDFLFVSDEEIIKKFSEINKLEVLYLSNLIHGKGYLELLEAYLVLSDDLRADINLTFVGGFENDES